MLANPPLILLTGTPTAGKSTLGRLLAERLNLVFLSKDAYKDGLFDTLGYSDPAWSSKLSKAAYAGLYTSMNALFDAKQGMVAEANWRTRESEPTILPFIARSRACVIHVTCDLTIVRERFAARIAGTAPGRHPGHMDATLLDSTLEAITQGRYDALELPDVPFLRVDTSAGYAPDLSEIEAFCRQVTQ